MKTLKYIIGSLAMIAFSLVNAQTELTVYTAVEAEDLKKYAQRFNEEHPDIKINWVRDSTGIVTKNPKSRYYLGAGCNQFIAYERRRHA